MSLPTTPHATVLRSIYRKKTVADLVAIGDTVYATASTAAEVAASPVATNALANLKSATDALRLTLASRVALALSFKAVVKTEVNDVIEQKHSLAAYMAVIDHLANGDQTVINHAGLEARLDKARPALDRPSKLTSRPGKHPGEAILRWAAGPGAFAYALEVNFTPVVVGSPWTPLPAGGSRIRVVKAPAASAQFLVRVASIGATANSDWTDPVLATAL